MRANSTVYGEIRVILYCEFQFYSCTQKYTSHVPFNLKLICVACYIYCPVEDLWPCPRNSYWERGKENVNV